MEFCFETEYNARAMAVAAGALRKTVRKKHSRRSHVVGWIIVPLGLLLALRNFGPNLKTAVTLTAVLAITLALLFEDRINGFFAAKRMLPGMSRATAVFTEDGFVSETAIGKTEWSYDTITTIAETGEYFVFLYGSNHAQLYDKRTLRGGTAEEFRRFLETAAGKQVVYIK